MLVFIGLMVGGYILTRCVDFSSRKDANMGTKIFASLTFFLTLFCLFGILASTGGIDATTMP